jgi:hypothetical protein
LAVARTRRAEAFRDGSWQLVDRSADLDRMQRQQQLVSALDAAVRAEVDAHPARLVKLVDAFLDHVKIDDTFGRGDVLRLARVLLGIDAAQIETHMLPVGPSPTDPNVTLATATGSDLTVQQLGGKLAASSLAPITPSPGDELRSC